MEGEEPGKVEVIGAAAMSEFGTGGSSVLCCD
jgi:hypothetical protein